MRTPARILAGIVRCSRQREEAAPVEHRSVRAPTNRKRRRAAALQDALRLSETQVYPLAPKPFGVGVRWSSSAFRPRSLASSLSRGIVALLTSAAAMLVVMAMALLAGCLSRPSLVKESFTFASPVVSNAAPAETGPVVSITRISVAAPFDTEALTYRTGSDSYERDPYAGFLVLPEESLAEPVRGYLRNSGCFRAVTEAGSAQASDIGLEISVPQLYGDFRDRSHPAAVLRMRFVAVGKNIRGKRGTVLLQKDYSRAIPLRARTAATLVAGWNEALKQIVSEAASDLKATLKQ